MVPMKKMTRMIAVIVLKLRYSSTHNGVVTLRKCYVFCVMSETFVNL